VLKIRVVRETVDETTDTPAQTREYLWIGCIVSDLSRIYPLPDETIPDLLEYSESQDGKIRASTRFEAFAEGIWYRISDPRINTLPSTEEDFIDQLYDKGCPKCMTINLNAAEPDEPCSHCEERFFCLNCKQPSECDELSATGYCSICEDLIECEVCYDRFHEDDVINNTCITCHTMSKHDAEIKKFQIQED
jgi:hypothetical protein